MGKGVFREKRDTMEGVWNEIMGRLKFCSAICQVCDSSSSSSNSSCCSKTGTKVIVYVVVKVAVAAAEAAAQQ